MPGMSTLVTGTNSGFGKLTVHTLARAGHRVIAAMRQVDGRNRQAADELREWAAAHGAELEVVGLDITDGTQVKAVISDVLARGPIDVVVNNAGVGSIGVLEAFEMEQIRHLFEINVFGHMHVNRAVLPAMRERGSGLLVHLSTTATRLFFPYLTPYLAAKAALETLAEELSFELAPFGVDSIIVEAGSYGTEIFSKLAYPADREVLASYGEHASTPEKMFGGLGAMLYGPGAPDPQEVADDIKALIDLPAGKRPLRTVVGGLGIAGVADFVVTQEAAKRKLLEGMGIS